MEATAVSERPDHKHSGWVALLDFLSKWGTLITIVVLIIFFAIAMPPFRSTANIVTILRSISIVTVIAIGITVSLTVDGFDLSVGSVATFADSLVISMFVWYNFGTPTAILAALAISLLVAVANAFLIVKLKIYDLLATLSMLFIIEGVALTYTGGGSISEGMPRLDGTPTFGDIEPVFRLIGAVALHNHHYARDCGLDAHLPELHQTRALSLCGGWQSGSRAPLRHPRRPLSYTGLFSLHVDGRHWGHYARRAHWVLAGECRCRLSHARCRRGLHRLFGRGHQKAQRHRHPCRRDPRGRAGERASDDVRTILLAQYCQG